MKLFKSLGKLDKMREEINVDDLSKLDDINIITTLKSIISDRMSGWEIKSGTSIDVIKKDNGVGLKLSCFYNFSDGNFTISSLFLTYFPKSSSYIQTGLKNKSLLTDEMVDFFYKIYYNSQIKSLELSKKEMEIKNNILQNIIGKANIRDSRLNDLLN